MSFESFTGAQKPDSRVAQDAALKMLAIAYMIGEMFPGSASDAVEMVNELPAGEALLAYFSTVDLGLPLVAQDTNLAALLDEVIELWGAEAVQTLAGATSEDATQKAIDVLDELTGAIAAKPLEYEYVAALRLEARVVSAHSHLTLTSSGVRVKNSTTERARAAGIVGRSIVTESRKACVAIHDCTRRVLPLFLSRHHEQRVEPQ